MRYLKLLLSIYMILLLTGCQVIPPLNINEIAMIQGMGFDRSGEGKMLGTILYPEYKEGEISKVKIVKAEGETVRKVIDISKSEVQYPLVNGQLRVAVIGKELAEDGIYPLIDTFTRSPTIGNLVQLAVVDGKASELLSAKDPGNISLYIQEMIEQNIKEGELPSTNLTLFNYKFYDEGNDPYLPLLKKDKDSIKISGIALFDKDKLKFTLPVKDMFILKLLEEKFRLGAHQFKVADSEFVVISNVKTVPHYKERIRNGVPEFFINIKMNARIQEYTSHKHITISSKIKSFEKDIENRIEKDAQRIIGLLQKNDVDPLGLGARFEAHYRDFNLKKWEEMYPNVKVNVNVDLIIAQSGISE